MGTSDMVMAPCELVTMKFAICSLRVRGMEKASRPFACTQLSIAVLRAQCHLHISKDGTQVPILLSLTGE